MLLLVAVGNLHICSCHHYFQISEDSLPWAELLKIMVPNTWPLCQFCVLAASPWVLTEPQTRLFLEGKKLELGASSLTFTPTTNFITFSGIPCEGREWPALVRYADLGSGFYTGVSMTLKTLRLLSICVGFFWGFFWYEFWKNDNKLKRF